MKEFFILFLGIGVLLLTASINCNPVDVDKVSDLTKPLQEVNDASKEDVVNRYAYSANPIISQYQHNNM